jgi:hypothetical protein
MLSESARTTTAAEARFRIQAPNSSRRSVAIVALDAAGAALAGELAALPWNGAAFWHWSDFAAEGEGLGAFLADLAGRTRRLVEVVEAADLVVLIAGTAGAESPALTALAEAIAARRVTAVGMLLAKDAAAEGLSAALARLRAHVGMLVIVQDRDYAAAMLEALRA